MDFRMSNHQIQTSKEARLKAIIFSSPGLLALNGTKTSDPTSLFPYQMKIGIKPHSNDFTSSLANPAIQLSEVPTYFGSPPQQNFLPWHSHPGSMTLGDTIQYQFTDNLVITAREILYHKYCSRVPVSLLPLMTQIRPETSHQPWLRLLPQEKLPLWGNLRKAELTLISILMNASSYASQGNPDDRVEVWITHSLERETERNASRLNSVQILPRPRSFWQLTPENGYASLSFVEVPFDSHGQIFQGFELDSHAGSLYFHPYHAMSELIYHSIYSELGETSYNELLVEQVNQLSSFKLPTQDHYFIQKLTQELDHKLQIQNFNLIQRIGLQNILPSQINSQIWITTQGEIQFCREIETESGSIEVWNFPEIINLMLKGLVGGLGATTQQDNKLIAQDRRGIKRDRDLKVLRHAGLFAVILLETSQYSIQKQKLDDPSQLSFADFFKTLLIRLGALLFEIEKKAGFIDLSPAPSLDKICSKKIIELIEEFASKISHLVESKTESIFTNKEELRLHGGVKIVVEIFELLLSKMAIESRGQCFLKPRMNAFSHFFGKNDETSLHKLLIRPKVPTPAPPEAAQRYHLSNNWLSSSDLLQTLIPLQNSGVCLFYGGLPLDQMNTLDFKPVFNLVEPEEIHKKSKTSIDWFELHPKFFFKGIEVDPTRLERLSKEGVLEFQGKIYLIQDKHLPSVKRLEAFWAKIQSGSSSEVKQKKEEKFLRLPRSQTLEMLALRASGVLVEGSGRWQKICQFYDSLSKKRELLNLPISVIAQLKAYQKIGVQWLLDLYDLGLGGILADDMGLGKTIQTLAFLETLRNRDEMGLVLIVVPTSLTYNWMSEATRFTPELPTQIFQSKSKQQIATFLTENRQAVLISTYGLFTEHQEFFENQRWNILVFDEAQNLKNITAKRTTASRSVSAKFKLCLTGTPLENHLGEFYSLMDLVVSGSLGEIGTFREKYITPDTLLQDDVKYLKLKSKPLVLRRTKTEILSELPPKIESTIKLPFEQKQEKIYRDIALSWNEKVKDSIMSQGESKSQLLMLTALLRLRQACSDPASIPNVKYTEAPPKLTVLMEALQEITESGESALVFTQFLHTFNRIKKELQLQKISSFSLHGGTSRAERERTLQGFQQTTQGSVLLMTLKTGGVGLNLVKASYVFHLEPWWNPAVENQASDRAHRIGQRKPVQVYRYLMRESVEEKIEILKERKSAKFNSLFSTTEDGAETVAGNGHLSQSDFDYLLK